MIEIRINITSLCDGSNILKVHRFCNKDKAKSWLASYLGALDSSLPKKFFNAEKRFRKGTSKGIKIFYSPERGVRRYLWISIFEETTLL